MFVASYGHPSHHGVMNPSVLLTRGTHSGGQVDMHIKMHTSIRTNTFTIVILFMGVENVFFTCRKYVSTEKREADVLQRRH